MASNYTENPAFSTPSSYLDQPDWLYPPATGLGLLGVSIIMANIFVIGFYQQKCRETVPMMYIMIATCDSVTGLTSLCHAGIFTAQKYQIAGLLKGKGWPNADLFLICLYIVLQTSTRTSLFYNSVLSVVRTINIVRPFYQLNKNILILCLICYPILWIVLLVIDVCLIDEFYDGSLGVLNVVFILLPGHGFLYAMNLPGGRDLFLRVLEYLVTTIFTAIPFALPALTSLVCAVLQIYSLLKPSTISPTTSKERRMTVTIIMLTVVCLVCNVPYTVMWFYIYAEFGESGYVTGISISAFICIAYSLGTLLPFINAILSPMILVLRGAALRGFVVHTVRRLYNRRTAVVNVEETEMEVIGSPYHAEITED